MELSGLHEKDRVGATQPLVSQESPYQTTTMAGRSRLNLYLACIAGNCFISFSSDINI